MKALLKFFVILWIFSLPACSLWDSEAPEISLIQPVQGAVVSPMFLIEGRVFDSNGVKSIKYSLDGAQWEMPEGLEHWYKTLILYDEGIHYLALQAEDYSGNIAATMISLTMEEQ